MKLRGLSRFLSEYPGMSLAPSRTPDTVLSGLFEFQATGAGHHVEDAFHLKIIVPRSFPADLPRVFETGSRIPRPGDYHVNPDETLCLGSHLRLKKALLTDPSLMEFAAKCIVPYLFNVSI